MTVLQIKIVVLTNDLGSISKAAKELNISQPNASNCIKSLEKEIGFNIFNRTKQGSTLTEKGSLFIERARRILAENEAIMDIQNHADVYRLRLGAVNYGIATKPFIKLCTEHSNDAETEFRFNYVFVEEGIKGLINYNLDVLVAPLMKSQIAAIGDICKNNNLAQIPICKIDTVLNVRKNHPAIASGKCEGITQGSDALKEYPYVVYRKSYEDSGVTGYNDSDFVQCKYKIYVDDADTRLRIVSCTDAFSFGIKHSKEFNEKYGIVSFDVPGVSVELFCFARANNLNRKEINDYISILKQEMLDDVGVI